MRLSLKRNIPLLILLLIVSIVVFIACRRSLDLSFEQDYEKQFFSVPANTDPLVKEIANKIYRQNQQFGFVNDLVRRIGFPRWDKSSVSKSDGSDALTRTTNVSSDEYIFIPFVKETGNSVNSILAIKITPDKALYKLLYEEAYSLYGFDYTDTTKTHARGIMTMFAYFNKAIFGYEEYLIKDQKLLNQADLQALASRNLSFSTAKVYFTVKDTSTHNCENCSFAVQPGCPQIAVCFVPNGTQPCETCDAQCTYFAGYSPCWSSYVGTIFEQDPFVVEGDNGGGGLPSGWWETPCEEDPSGSGRAEPCDGLPGWEPVVPAGGNPAPSYNNWGAVHLDTWYVSLADQIEIENWRLNNIDTSGLDSCRKILLKKLLTGLDSNNILGKILAKIDRSITEPNNIEKFVVKYKIQRLDSVVAQTGSYTYNTVTKVFGCTILLDSAIANTATDIYVAGTILHETIHAYMKSILLRIKNGVTLQQIQAMSYDSVFNEYVDSLTARNRALIPSIINDPQSDHNYMASKLLNIIADALKIFDGNMINNDRYYWFLAWKGLYKSKPWKQHWPNYAIWPITGAPYTTDDSTRGLKYALTPSRLDSIIDAIYNERVANSNAKGRPPLPGGCY